jgi:hypothetical protein
MYYGLILDLHVDVLNFFSAKSEFLFCSLAVLVLFII